MYNPPPVAIYDSTTLINKLRHILRLRALEGTGNMAASLFQASDSNNMSLVRECYFLEDQLGIGNTNEVLKGNMMDVRRH